MERYRALPCFSNSNPLIRQRLAARYKSIPSTGFDATGNGRKKKERGDGSSRLRVKLKIKIYDCIKRKERRASREGRKFGKQWQTTGHCSGFLRVITTRSSYFLNLTVPLPFESRVIFSA